MCGVRASRTVVASAYVVLYMAILGLVSFYATFAYEQATPFLDSEAMRLSKSPLSSHIVGTAINVGYIALVVYWNGASLWRLLLHVTRLQSHPEGATSESQQRRNPYRSPFSAVWLSLITFPVVWLLNLSLHIVHT